MLCCQALSSIIFLRIFDNIDGSHHHTYGVLLPLIVLTVFCGWCVVAGVLLLSVLYVVLMLSVEFSFGAHGGREEVAEDEDF